MIIGMIGSSPLYGISDGKELQIARLHTYTRTHTQNTQLPNCVLVRWMIASLTDDNDSLNRWQ